MILPKKLCPIFDDLAFSDLVPGRVTRISTFNSSSRTSLNFYAVHNFGFTSDDMGVVEDYITSDIDIINDDPLHHNLILMGDLNLENSEVQRVSYDSPRPAPDAFQERSTPSNAA